MTLPTASPADKDQMPRLAEPSLLLLWHLPARSLDLHCTGFHRILKMPGQGVLVGKAVYTVLLALAGKGGVRDVICDLRSWKAQCDFF